MAKNRSADDYDDFPSEAAAQPAAPARPQQATLPVAPASDDEAVKAALLEVQKANALLMQDYLMQRARDLESQQDHERKRDWCQLSATERTQKVADERWGAETAERWAVSLPGDPSQPRLLIPARSDGEAIGKYQQLCGIRSTEHEFQASRQ